MKWRILTKCPAEELAVPAVVQPDLPTVADKPKGD